MLKQVQYDSSTTIVATLQSRYQNLRLVTCSLQLAGQIHTFHFGSTVILMEMGFFVVVGHFHEADTSSTKFVVEPSF